MGKPTGFMEYPRCENRRRPPLERAADWEDIYVPVEGAQRLEQGARGRAVHELRRALLPGGRPL